MNAWAESFASMELTIIGVMVGFLTLVAALTVSRALQDTMEKSPVLEKYNEWGAAAVAVALMIVGSLLLSFRVRAVKQRVPTAKPVDQGVLEQNA